MPAFRHGLALALDAGDPSLVRVGERFGMTARALPQEFTGNAGAHVLRPAPLR